MPPDERHNLYMRYYDRVVRYLVRKYRFTPDEARDLAQDVFLRVFRHMEQKAITSQWLFVKTTAHNVAVNDIRRRVTHRKSESGSTEAVPDLGEALLHDFWTDDPPPSPEIVTSRKEELALLRDAIEELPEALRTPVLLRLGGLSYEEIAIALRITTDAVRTRLRDGKRLLLNRMRPGGG